ncbi:ATP-binding cassette domain-containing protein [Mucilaginibacter terrenus]|uniref:ATP-binding cassette domain-containing protein n=1 Tax=Mucilaginibacter terrenus TaxID=2482727 RepID=A0A3E2NQ48_9SPHI|nr:ATP-binding cassette domain-containing protein [Mucilaginibacter terrenus]RFZ83124.1 ATP-binding cassette domain-containing protein [Mucilaginibacter terrenus]
MIKVEHLRKSFGGNRAVDDVSFEVKEGETMALLGTSGCGKTTTLKMINRLIEPDSGVISINGKDVFSQHPEVLRRSVGYVLQNNGLFPHYTVAENVAIVPNLLKWDQAKTKERINQLFDKLHLGSEYLNAYPTQLSGGQQQRVGLARALMADPPVLLMDEPFGALDNVTRSKIHAEFKALDELKRKTIILVTHDVGEAFELADRIAVMDKGRIIQIGTPAELLFKPANDFVKSFLDEQRLQLEFKAIKVADLWDLLPDNGTENPSQKLPANTDVWAVLEQYKGKENSALQFYDHQKSAKTTLIKELVDAFLKYRSPNA